MSFIIAYVTHENTSEARKLVEPLIEDGIIACVNYFPITAMYRWREGIEESGEVVSLLKTRSENWDALCERIERLHSYETPCIIRLDVTANQGYEEWIHESTETITK